ncbi:SAM-dependent methyltransferase [Paenibacillus lautus]|uniref:SAM-dependent methyltransferase n=1 Tax=Paenibacillus lautus TaxID=1401 RepID=UPI0026F20119|nr:SAM-dependent methyltransferase [Paenibacillus lautus]MCI1777721.1 SAM-dependent methyltransferase [Paenibacillus lautus]
MKLTMFDQSLADYLTKFKYFADRFDHISRHRTELERLVDDYSAFITDESNSHIWDELERQGTVGLNGLVEQLRAYSARCVATLEKYRALKLIKGDTEITDYFRNIEECIEKEFGSFQVTSKSIVLLVGSGAFPMTALLIAKRTGAEVIGIDIDDEAIRLGIRVIETLGPDLKIRLENTPVEYLDYIKEVTHIIFSSTVADKYDMLERLHPLTNEEVVVAMRYGNRLKSLFNYPMKETDEDKWIIVDTGLRQNDIFDIALYKKSIIAHGKSK